MITENNDQLPFPNQPEDHNPEKEKKEIVNKWLVLMPVLVSISLGVGVVIGAGVFGRSVPVGGSDVSRNVKKLRDVLSYVSQYYVDDVKEDEMVDFAITQMLTKLDPHTQYISSQDYSLFNDHLEGGFEGVGIEYQIFQDTLFVMKAMEGGPSAKAGLEAGDKIVGVDTTELTGINISNKLVYEKLRGKKGTAVELKVARNGVDSLLSFTVIRDKIPTYSVEVAMMVNDTTGFIKINNFGVNTYDEFIAGLRKLKSNGMRQLVLDLRDNGGGYMSPAVSIADEFLKEGEMIVFTKSREASFSDEIYSEKEGECANQPLIVLINEYSASASEILTGALQDNDRALVVGRRSFGKGLVQKPIQLADNSQLRLTISRYYTPSGRSIQKPYGKGIDYKDDLHARIEHGEMFNEDSIQVNEEEVFFTSGGRKVHGGGGISPDFFVPWDSVTVNSYYRQILYRGLPQEFAFRFVQEHKERLFSMTQREFYPNPGFFKEITDSFAAFLKMRDVNAGEVMDVTRDQKIMREVLALVGRNIFGEEGYYLVSLSDDKEFKEAVVRFEEAQALINE